MAKYRLSNEAKNVLIKIHHYGVEKSGMTQDDKYFESFFEYFEIITQRPYSFESVEYIKKRQNTQLTIHIYAKIDEFSVVTPIISANYLLRILCLASI